MSDVANKNKLDKIEASGLITAARFVRKIGKDHSHKITIEDVYQIHKKIFAKARPDIAGKLRKCEIKKLYCSIPPHSSKVPELMFEFGKVLEKKINVLNKININKLSPENLQRIIQAAAWASHQVSIIHPFDEGNGRTARELINLILIKYGLPAIHFQVTLRSEYLDGLCQIDNYKDYEPLTKLISQQIGNYYDDLRIKKLNYQKSKHK